MADSFSYISSRHRGFSINQLQHRIHLVFMAISAESQSLSVLSSEFLLRYIFSMINMDEVKQRKVKAIKNYISL